MRNWVCFACIVLCLTPSLASAQSTDISASDFDGSGRVDFVDFLDFAAAFGLNQGQDGYDSKFDLDGSNVVDFGDFLIFAANFGDSTTEVSETYLYVSDIFNNRVEAIDIATNLAIPSRSFSVDFPRGMALGPQTGFVYVVTLDSLLVFSEGSYSHGIAFTQFENPVTGGPGSPSGFKVTINDAETRAYVTLTAAEAVEVVDLSTRSSIAQVPVGLNPGSALLSPDETVLYVGLRTNHIAVVDLAQNAKTDSLVIGTLGSNKLALSPDAATIYASTITPDSEHASGSLTQILAIDQASGAVIDSVQISSPANLSDQVVELATNPQSGNVYVTMTSTRLEQMDGFDVASFTGNMVVLSSPLELIDTINIGESSAGFGISPDGTTAYVSGIEELATGVIRIFVVDLGTGERLSQLPLAIQSATEFVFQSTKQALAELTASLEFAFSF